MIEKKLIRIGNFCICKMSSFLIDYDGNFSSVKNHIEFDLAGVAEELNVRAESIMAIESKLTKDVINLVATKRARAGNVMLENVKILNGEWSEIVSYAREKCQLTIVTQFELDETGKIICGAWIKFPQHYKDNLGYLELFYERFETTLEGFI